MAVKTVAAKIGFRELAGLHHRAFGTLKDRQARRVKRAQGSERGGFGRMSDRHGGMGLGHNRAQSATFGKIHIKISRYEDSMVD
jgi:hypothetical protein